MTNILCNYIPLPQSCLGKKYPEVLWCTHEQTLHYLDMDKELSQRPTKALLINHSQPEKK